MPGPAGDHPDPPVRVRHGQQQGEHHVSVTTGAWSQSNIVWKIENKVRYKIDNIRKDVFMCKPVQVSRQINPFCPCPLHGIRIDLDRVMCDVLCNK